MGEFAASLNVQKQSVSASEELRPPDPPTMGFAPGPAGGSAPKPLL